MNQYVQVNKPAQIPSIPAGVEVSNEKTRRELLIFVSFVFCAILFSLFTVFVQVTTLSLHYLETTQVVRHMRVLQGNAGDAWQYRVLSEYLVEWLIRGVTILGL